MKFSYIFGIGLACAACCAIPLLGLGGGALGGAFIAHLLGESFQEIVCILVPALLIAGLALMLWQRRRKQTSPACPADRSCDC